MNLYIMSRGRAGRVATLKQIHPDLYDRTYLVVPAEEFHDYSRAYPDVQLRGWGPELAANYSRKFQSLLEQIDDEGGKGVIMDDDLTWAARPPDGAQRLVPVDDVQMKHAWARVEEYLNDYALVGFHPRLMGHQAPLPYKLVGKQITVQAVNTNLFPAYIPRVDYDPILADVHLVCYLLSRGVPNCLITEYVVNWGPSQAAGGCDYRTAEMQEIAVKRVADMYPEAKAVWKKNKGANWLGDEGRWDLEVQWKKMFENRRNKK